MGRSYLTVDVEKLESKEDAEAKKRLLEADAHDNYVFVHSFLARRLWCALRGVVSLSTKRSTG